MYYFCFLESDLIPGLATFFACLVLPLEIGVLIGIGLNLVSILYHAARPKLLIEVHKVSIIYVHVIGLVFTQNLGSLQK